MYYVPIKNPDISDEEKTYLTTAVAAAGATLVVADYEGISDNDYLILGPVGKEQTELTQVNGAPSSTSITIQS